ncbi:unnamed protein product [Cyclocybe aegerita]|uniref:Reverse transcriptase domain-containing protein n=1 Tax=Cyclocybe aegerita TaxID=1973307 RepID=A0A8S0X8S7_CYCAE|nr:unnamed protein product [Cyclocybe aegerita]
MATDFSRIRGPGELNNFSLASLLEAETSSKDEPTIHPAPVFRPPPPAARGPLDEGVAGVGASPDVLMQALDDLGRPASPPRIPASKKRKGVDRPVPPPPQKKSKVAYSHPGPPPLINRATKPKPRPTTWAGIAKQAAPMPPPPPGLGPQRRGPSPPPAFPTGPMKTSPHRSVPSFTSEGPTRKQVLVSFGGTPPDLTKFFTESAVRAANGYLRDGRSMLKVTSIVRAYDGLSLVTPTVASSSDLDILRNFIRESLPMGLKITQEALEKALRTSVHAEVFAYLSTKPRIDRNSAHSTSCTVYCNIWDSQQGTRAKKALSQPIFLAGRSCAIRPAARHTGVPLCQRCWKWGHPTVACKAKQLSCPICSGLCMEGNEVIGAPKHPDWLQMVRIKEGEVPRVIAYVSTRLSRYCPAMRRDILVLSLFSRGEVLNLMNVYSDDQHTAIEHLAARVHSLPPFIYMAGDFNCVSTTWDDYEHGESSTAISLRDTASQIGLEWARPSNHGPTRISPNPNQRSNVLDLVFLAPSEILISMPRLEHDLQGARLKSLSFWMDLAAIPVAALTTKEGIEALANAIATAFSDAWLAHATESKPTKRSKSWWTDECSETFRVYQLSCSLNNIVKNDFFDECIAEIATSRKRPWDLMEWVKQCKLPPCEAIHNGDQHCHDMDDLWDALHGTPIVLLITFGKLIEKMIANRIQFDTVKHDIFHPNQLGSIRQRSTEDAGLILTHLVRVEWVKGLQTSALAFDIAQFFPSINHEMFMAVLHKQGFSPVLVEFFASYLVGRSTVYCWNTFQSDSRSADVGVGQDSALSPVISGLFIALVMKLFYIKAAPLNMTLLSFVDDGTILAQSKQLDDNNVGLRKAYKIIYLLFVTFALALEHDKTELFHFSRRRDAYNPSLDLGYAPHTGVTPLKPKTYWRYLGFYFDRGLTFHEHVRYYATKAFTTVQAMRMLGNSTRGLSPKQRRLLYRSSGLIPVHLMLKKLATRAVYRVATLSDTHPLRSMMGEGLLKRAAPHARSAALMTPAMQGKVKSTVMEVDEHVHTLTESFEPFAPEARPGDRLLDRYADHLRFDKRDPTQDRRHI